MALMTREEIINEVADYFGVEEFEDMYDLDGYTWTSGCYLRNNVWLSLGEVVHLIERIVEELDY